jgi:mono/diheme cytochrome c family protein
MRRRLACVVILLAAMQLVKPAIAEMDDSSYASDSAPLDAKQREVQARKLLEEIAAERARESAARAARDAAAAAETARLAARPLGERLVEARCGACHGATQIAQAAYGAWGWWFTVQRMRWINGAQIDADEIEPIVGYLSQGQQNRTRQEKLLAIAAGLCVIAVSGLGVGLRRRKRLALRDMAS